MSRRIEALRALAERPGTPEEGRLAAEMLAKIQAKGGDPAEEDRWRLFERYLRTNCMDDLMRACSAPVQCSCGVKHGAKEKCPATSRHTGIAEDIRAEFKRGDRVFYNYWAYPMNAAARVVGYPRDQLHCWGWIRLQFDHLKNPRAVPIVSVRGMHLSHEPLPEVKAKEMSRG